MEGPVLYQRQDYLTVVVCGRYWAHRSRKYSLISTIVTHQLLLLSILVILDIIAPLLDNSNQVQEVRKTEILSLQALTLAEVLAYNNKHSQDFHQQRVSTTNSASIPEIPSLYFGIFINGEPKKCCLLKNLITIS